MLLMFFVGTGVVVGYHRVLTHRAARFVRPLELFLLFCGIGAGTPLWATIDITTPTPTRS